MIARSHNDYFSIVMATVTVLRDESQERTRRFCGAPGWATFPERHFQLAWDWVRSSHTTQALEWYDTWKETKQPAKGQLGVKNRLARARRTWNVALILGDVPTLTEDQMAWQENMVGYRGREAVKDCEIAINKGGMYKLDLQPDATATSRSSKTNCDGWKDVKDLQFKNPKMGMNYRLDTGDHTHGSLLLAAEGEHAGVIQLLLDSIPEFPRGLLLTAARRGNHALAESLLKSGRVDSEEKGINGETPLFLAARFGHQRIVRMLLETNEVALDAGA